LTKRQRFELICGELRDRLFRVCRDMPREEFEQLVARMARLKLRYEPWSGMPARNDGGHPSSA
jgi:hypothetical protein